MARSFRFGVNVRTTGSRAEWAGKAQKVEDLGYDVLLIPVHLADLPTTRLRIGTAVLNNDFRYPVLVAREAATLDVLSDGWLELGIGAGHTQSEYEQAGLRFDPGATRRAAHRVRRRDQAVVRGRGGDVRRAALPGDSIGDIKAHSRTTPSVHR